MHSLGNVWHPGSGVPCFGGFKEFRSLWGLTVSLSSLFLPYLPYLNAVLRWRLVSWLWGSLFRRIWGVSQPLGAHSFTFFLIPYFPYLTAFLRWRLASWLWGSLFRRIWGVSQPLGAHCLTFFLIFPILMHSLGDVWHPGSGVPCFGGFGGFLWGSLFRKIWEVSQPLGAHSLTFFLTYLPYLNAFLRWRLASWLWGSLFRRIWGVSQPLGAHSLTFFLISSFFPILMQSLGDVWHPGSGIPCFGGFGGFRSLWGLTVSLSSLHRRRRGVVVSQRASVHRCLVPPWKLMRLGCDVFSADLWLFLALARVSRTVFETLRVISIPDATGSEKQVANNTGYHQKRSSTVSLAS